MAKKLTKTKVRCVDYRESLLQDLQNPEEALAYLNAALIDENQEVFLLALKDVLEAQGGSFSGLSKKTQLNRENLYRMFSKKGNPKLKNLRSVLHVFGWELAVRPHAK